MAKLSEVQKAINKEDDVLVQGNFVKEMDRIPTGIVAIDQILAGGFPVENMVELYGNHGSGKSSIAMMFTAQAQKLGNVVWIDLENAFSSEMADNSGVNMDDLWIAQPVSAEDTFKLVEQVQGADDVSAIVVDSVAGLTPRAEIEGDFGDAHVGLTARLLSQALRKLVTTQRQTHAPVIIVWINQIREKIGSMGYGPTTDSTGGRALKFWCSTRLEVSRTGAVKQGEDIIGHTVKVKAAKSRFAAPFQTTNFDIIYETGVSNESTLLEIGLQNKLITKGGAWFTFTETGEKVQGKLAALDVIRNDQELYDSIRSLV